VVVDTALAPPHDIELGAPPGLPRPSYVVQGHAVVVLERMA